MCHIQSFSSTMLCSSEIKIVRYIRSLIIISSSENVRIKTLCLICNTINWGGPRRPPNGWAGPALSTAFQTAFHPIRMHILWTPLAASNSLDSPSQQLQVVTTHTYHCKVGQHILLLPQTSEQACMSTTDLKSFYRCSIEPTITAYMASWYCNFTKHRSIKHSGGCETQSTCEDHRHSAPSWAGHLHHTLPYKGRLHHVGPQSTHTHTLCSLFPFGKRLRSISTHTHTHPGSATASVTKTLKQLLTALWLSHPCNAADTVT